MPLVGASAGIVRPDNSGSLALGRAIGKGTLGSETSSASTAVAVSACGGAPGGVPSAQATSKSAEAKARFAVETRPRARTLDTPLAISSSELFIVTNLSFAA